MTLAVVIFWFVLMPGEQPSIHSTPHETQAECESFRKGMIASFEAQGNKEYAEMERRESCRGFMLWETSGVVY